MSDYKNIIGKPIKSISSNLDNDQAEGQVWYNTTDQQFKNVISSNAFASTGSLLDSYYGAGGAGSQTVGMVFGGISPSNSTKTTTEEYDGTGFVAGGSLNTGRNLIAGCGTVPAGLAF